MSRPINILHLPLEILVNIFRYFEDSQDCFTVRSHWRECLKQENVKSRRQTVRNARLVCRLFEKLASPHLFSTLEIDISEESLDFVQKICERPHTAEAIRHISLSLYYLPQGVASDISHFKANRTARLTEFYHRCIVKESADDFEESETEKLSRAIDVYGEIVEAWDAYFDPTNHDVMPQELWTYQQCLLQGYQDYREQQEKQSRLITQQTFVTNLAASLARLPLPCSLSLSDLIDAHPHICGLNDPTIVFSNFETLRKFMTIPFTWGEVECMEEGVPLLPARILSELPIAMDKAGASLRQWAVRCSPITRSSSILPPMKQYFERPIWGDLKHSCADLEVFQFTPDEPIEAAKRREQQGEVLDQYLLHILCSRKLWYISISLFGLGLIDEFHHVVGYCHLGTVFRCADWHWPDMSTLKLSYVSLDQLSLESLCTALGPNVRYFYMRHVNLTQGSWSNALDILQENLHTQGSSKVYLSCLSGGEFDREECRVINHMPHAWLQQKGWAFNDEDSIAVQLAGMYVANAGMELNPLRVDMRRILIKGPPKSQ